MTKDERIKELVDIASKGCEKRLSNSQVAMNLYEIDVKDSVIEMMQDRRRILTSCVDVDITIIF